MKIYNFKTFKHRYPHTHSWQVEVMWKKLPIAPQKVKKVALKHNVGDSTVSGVLLEEGMSLVDEQNRELIWTKDSQGYFHMGSEIPSLAQQYEIAHPKTVEVTKDLQKKEEEYKKYALYKDMSGEIAALKHQMKSDKKSDQIDAAASLELYGNSWKLK